jgi:hypothetical protein
MSNLNKPVPVDMPCWVCGYDDCGHVWVCQDEDKVPAQCPKCRKRNWCRLLTFDDDMNVVHDPSVQIEQKKSRKEPKKKSGAIHCIFNGRSGSEFTYCGKAYDEVEFVEDEEQEWEKVTCKACLRIMGSGPSANRKCGAAMSTQVGMKSEPVQSAQPVGCSYEKSDDNGVNHPCPNKFYKLDKTGCRACRFHYEMMQPKKSVQLEHPKSTHFCKTCNQPVGKIHMQHCPDHKFVALGAAQPRPALPSPPED